MSNNTVDHSPAELQRRWLKDRKVLENQMESHLPSSLVLNPIGYIRTEKQVKFQALHQPAEDQPERNRLELLPGNHYETALKDLTGFSRIWLVWWFHRNTTWRPMVLPPRGPSKRRGVFATRSPHRPNPLGLTPVQLIRIKGLTLTLGPCDLVDGTPVFDIKPYLRAYDSFPDAEAGWWDEAETALQEPPQFSVQLSELANAQSVWLRVHWSIDFHARMIELLSRDPTPHRGRRIRKRKSGGFEIGCGAWRAQFNVDGTVVSVVAIDPAYPRRFLTDPNRPGIPDGAAQLAFLECWPCVDE